MNEKDPFDAFLPSAGAAVARLVEEMVRTSPPPKERQTQDIFERARGFLNCAKEDYEAANLLRRQQIFSLSVYHLQQAVEKVTKGYALAFFAIRPAELRKIGHKSPLAFIRILKRSWVANYAKLIKGFYPDLKTSTADVEEIVEEKQEELAKLPKSVILLWISIGGKMRASFKNTDIINDITNKVLSLVHTLPGSVRHSAPVNEVEASIKDALNTAICFGNLYILSALTYPHFSFARYPDGNILPSHYVDGLGIVDCEDEILNEVEIAIKALEEYLREREQGLSPSEK